MNKWDPIPNDPGVPPHETWLQKQERIWAAKQAADEARARAQFADIAARKSKPVVPSRPGKRAFAPPVAYGTSTRSKKQRISKKASSKYMNIAHREYIGEVSSKVTGFEISNSGILNPGNETVFPWLSQIAHDYETYAFQKLSLIYEPVCATTSAGSVAIAIDYDVNDPIPLGWGEVTGMSASVHGSVFAPHRYNAARADLKAINGKWKHIANKPSAPDVDNDLGRFYLVQDLAAVQNLGKLYIEYSVLLSTPERSHPKTGSVIATLATTGVIVSASPEGNPPVVQSTSAILTGYYASLTHCFEFARDFHGLVHVSASDSAGHSLTGNDRLLFEGNITGRNHAIYSSGLALRDSGVINAAGDQVSQIIEIRAGQGSKFAYEADGATAVNCFITYTFVDYDTQNTITARKLAAREFPAIVFAGADIDAKL